MAQSPLSDSFLLLSRRQDPLLNNKKNFALDNGTEVRIHGLGVIEFEPKENPSKSLVYSCGIHGNETAPIEICDALVEDILNLKIELRHRLLVIFGNLAAMNKQSRFIEENLNRLFCGHHKKGERNEEKRRAEFLESCVTDFFSRSHQNETRIHYDLHTAIRGSKNEKFAVYPFLHGKPYSNEQFGFMQACGVDTILLSQSPTTTFSYYSSVTHHAHAFTVELGQVRPFGMNDMTKFKQADNALRSLATQSSYYSKVNSTTLLLYRVNQVIIKTQLDFTLNFDEDTFNFTDFNKGQELARETGHRYVAEMNGEAIVFPNADVAIGQRALLTVIPATLDKNQCLN